MKLNDLQNDNKISGNEKIEDNHPNNNKKRYEKIFKKKAFFLSHTINKIFDCLSGKHLEDDRDHFANKRIELSGDLLTSLFK
jgi:DNA-directed RNA polymerase beta subunit